MPEQAVILSVTTGASHWWMGVRDDETVRAVSINPAAPPEVEAPEADTPDADNPDVAGKSPLFQAAQTLREFGTPADGIVLALPSRWCLAGRTSTDGLLRRGRQQALLYRMEDHWPVEAERLTAAFVGQGDEAFGIAVQTDRVRPLLDVFADEGVAVSAIVPAALLLPPISAERANPDAVQDVLWFRSKQQDHLEGRVDVVRYRGQQPVAWRHCPSTDDAIDFLREGPGRVGDPDQSPATTVYLDDAANPDEPALDRVRLARPRCVVSDRNARAVIVEAASAWVDGDRPTPVADLQRAGLARRDRLSSVARPLTALIAAAALLLGSVAATQFLQAHSLHRATENLREAQAELFRDTFPGRPVPVALLSRLKSEAAEARGLAGESDPDARPPNVLHDLANVLYHLPGGVGHGGATDSPGEDFRVRVLELRIDGRQLYLDGQVRSHGDAERIAAALRSVPGFAFDAPRTQNLPERGVGFTLSGARFDEPPLAAPLARTSGGSP